jgi:hypothetical protein
MTELDVNMKGLQREWLAARIFAVLMILLVVAATAAAIIVPPNSLPGASADNSNAAAQRRAAALALCSAALATTQGFGIVPGFARLASDLVEAGTVRGRYTCFAQTGSAKYQITFDLMCDTLADAKCINLYSVTQDGSGALYQRH